MEGLSLLSVYLLDIIGSSIMICLALVAVGYTQRLRKLEPKKVLWSYFSWLCLALVTFAISRSIGHILKYVFIFLGYSNVWKDIAPVTGGLNSITFIIVGLLTFYYANMHKIIELFRGEARELASANLRLKEAHAAARQLNLSLEKKVEARTRELMQAEQKFRGLFEDSKDIIFFCNAQGKITDINDSFIEHLKYDKQEDVINRPLSDFFIEEDKCNYCHQSLSSLGYVNDFEVKFRRSDGSEIDLLISVTARKDDRETIKGSEWIAKDLTRFKQLTDDLIKKEKMASMGQLAAEVAHEIAGPLELIAGYTQLLEKDFEDQRDVYNTLNTLEKQTVICRKTVEDFIKFSHQSVDMALVDINQCLEKTLAVMEQILNMDRIYIKRKMAQGLPQVFGYEEKLRQAFLNIFNYARQVMEKDGIIGLWTRYGKETKEIEVVIGYTGPGIDPEIVDKILDPFFTTKRVWKGIGPGLTVSFGIIKAHEGHIEVQSPPCEQELIAADINTAFYIHLPAQDQKKTEEAIDTGSN